MAYSTKPTINQIHQEQPPGCLVFRGEYFHSRNLSGFLKLLAQKLNMCDFFLANALSPLRLGAL
jgi:hypothetical protein